MAPLTFRDTIIPDCIGDPDITFVIHIKTMWPDEHASTETLLEKFRFAEAECKALLAAGDKPGGHLMALPAYDQCIKASHVFNLLDARGVISVTERQAYILRVRDLAKGCCEAWAKTAGGSAKDHG